MQRFLLAFTTVFLSTTLALAGEWVSLSDSDSLEGWKKVGGGATYVSKDGVITGTTGEGKNTFLTRGPYSDFDLEFDVRCDPQLNSGVQIRSHQYGEETPQVLDSLASKCMQSRKVPALTASLGKIFVSESSIKTKRVSDLVHATIPA